MDTDAEVSKTVQADRMPVIEHSAEDSSNRLTFSNIRVRPAVAYVAVAAGLVVATAILRGQAISDWGLLNPDEAGLMASARAAFFSGPVEHLGNRNYRSLLDAFSCWARRARRAADAGFCSPAFSGSVGAHRVCFVCRHVPGDRSGTRIGGHHRVLVPSCDGVAGGPSGKLQ